MRVEARVAIGLGSNVGDRPGNLRHGVGLLRGLLEHLEASGVYETEPVGFTEQGRFLNACCTATTRLSPRQLLSTLLDLERAVGRTRGGPRYGPRTLDLDLLLYGERLIAEPGLTIPHPRMRERAFVLLPLREIAPDWRVPSPETQAGEAGESVADLAAGVSTVGVERTSIRLEG